MKKKFGDFHYCANFFDRIFYRSTSSPSDAIAAFRVASHLLKKFDVLQEQNPSVTLAFAADSLRVYFNGKNQFYIQTKRARTTIWIPAGCNRDIRAEIQTRPELFAVESGNVAFVVNEDGVEWLMGYLNSSWQESFAETSDAPATHPRYIPGEVRQAVLTDFLTSGSWCPGVAGISKRHEVGKTMRIEFDHILPHSVGGSNGYWNVQVLCSACNQLKRATAA